MKKFQIFKQKAGQQPVGYKYAIHNTFKCAQVELREFCRRHYADTDNYSYIDEIIAEEREWELIPVDGYTEPGIYEATGTGYELIISDREIDAAEFDRYSYDNWTEYIEEVEVEDEN